MVSHSRLDYCNALFYGAPENSLDQLQRLQNRAARILTLTPKFSHITPVLKNLHWLPVRQRIDYKIIFMVFKCLNGFAPEYLSDLIAPYVPARALRSADHHLLKLPGKTRLKTYGDRCFEVVGPTLWNNLPLNLRMPHTLDLFKKELKTHLFRAAYE